jgi:hypothetical protein
VVAGAPQQQSNQSTQKLGILTMNRFLHVDVSYPVILTIRWID